MTDTSVSFETDLSAFAKIPMSSQCTAGSPLPRCHFNDWYPIFRKQTIKSSVITLPEDFIDYLTQDSIFLPPSVSSLLGEGELSDDSDDESVSEEKSSPTPEFTDLNTSIVTEMSKFGGSAFIKLESVAPIDASWINGGTLKCSNISQIYLLLKSSTRIADLVSNRSNCHQLSLIIRKWSNLHPGMEFRCFVVKNCLKGICQRDCRYSTFLMVISEFFKSFFLYPLFKAAFTNFSLKIKTQ